MKTIAVIMALLAIPLLVFAEDEQPIPDNLLARMNPYIAGIPKIAAAPPVWTDAFLIEGTADAILIEGGADKLMLEE